jgi:hypothetical protein
MKVTLINHSSLLFSLNEDKDIFLTDFWNEQIAFGSWLPSAPPFYNSIYLASLSFKKNFHLVISHPHDDHIDDYFLEKYFNKEMKIIINNFSSKALTRRLTKIGFKNFINIDKEIYDFGNFQCISIFNPKISNDDCSLVFRDKKYCIYHGNDNWFEIDKENLNKIQKFKSNREMIYAAQTNSASGYPLTYKQFSTVEKQELLAEKNLKMLESGFKNVENIKADFFLPYAGFSKPYVKGENYQNEVFNPTYKNLINLIENKKINGKDKLLNIFCGGTFDFNSKKVSYPFNFNPDDVLKITDKYYHDNKTINKCHTYKDSFFEEVNDIKTLEEFLIKFNDFVKFYLKKNPEFYKSVIGKKIRFIIKNKKNDLNCNLKIGFETSFDLNKEVNKEFEITGVLFKALIDKKILFDDLYTGFMIKISRYPKNIYNRDIILYLVMFGYFYKNSK